MKPPPPEVVSRRAFLFRTVTVLTAATAASCRKADAVAFSCTDTGGLSPTDVAQRATAGYVDRAPDPTRACAGCQQFLGAPGACGACKLLRGPIHPAGTCKVFSPKG